MIKAIETEYKGYRFRSRMEARWAVFMDAASIRWVYEPDAYDLGNGTCYLPDFYLPQQDAFLEVKNPTAPKEEFEKVGKMAVAAKKLAYVFTSPPKLPDWEDYDGEGAIAYFYEQASGEPFPEEEGGYGSDSHYLWCQCPECGRMDLQFDGRADRIACNCTKSAHGDKGYNYDSPRLKGAYKTAAMHRFEPGAVNQIVPVYPTQ